MSRTTLRRLLNQSPLGLYSELTPVGRQSAKCLRLFSHTPKRKASPPQYAQPADDFKLPVQPNTASMKNLSSAFAKIVSQNEKGRLLKTRFNSDGVGMPVEQGTTTNVYKEPHHFHIYATRHNTHITVTNPERNPLLSVSCGNIGFRKSSRKHYDSAFQLAGYVMNRMKDQGISSQIERMEVVLRGFGAGREAVTKALLGLEGKDLRGKIVKVADATRLKFGGTRSRKPRRLG